MEIWKQISPLASFCFCAIQSLDLYRSEAEFVVWGLSREIIRMQFSSRTLKIVRTFLDRRSVTEKNYLPSWCILKKEKSVNWATEIFYFTNKVNANVQNKNLAIAIMKSSFQK